MFRGALIILVAVTFVNGRPSSGTSRILGGSDAVLGELPYQASLQYWGTSFHFAGGVLLSNRWVVTTAHGVFGRAQNSVNVVLGISRLDSTFTNRQSMEIRIHPLFNVVTLSNDIATIRTNANIVFTNHIAPIELSPTFVVDGTIAQVSGWGAMNEDKTNEPIILQRTVVTSGPCVDSEFITFAPANHFCAGNLPGTGSAGSVCTTDVGGPLVMNNLLIGIPFYHDPRACGRFLDGYLRISFYRSWIMGNIPL